MDIYELFYRNPDRTIDGQIATFEKLELNPIHNDVGTWSLQAPVEVLLSLVWKGGLVVKRNNDVFFTGRVTSMHRVKDKTAFPVIDTLEVSGVDDNSYLEDQLVLPVSSGPPYTSAEFDVRTGPFETVAKDYVSSTIGPNAKIDRQVTGLTIETDYARGSQVTGQGRFNRLLELLKSIALQSGGIGFRVVNMQFQVYPINDKSSFVVFSEDLGNLCGFTYDIDRPKANYIYLGGTGSGSSRVIAEGLNSDSILQYERIEEFLDQSSLSDIGQMYSKIQEELSKKAKQFSLKLKVADLPNMRPIDDYWLGDTVGVIIDGKLITDVISSAVISITPTVVSVEPIIGINDHTSDEVDSIYSTIRELGSRLGLMERN